MRLKKRVRIRAAVLLAAAVVGCVMLVQLHTQVFSLLSAATLHAAQSFLPAAVVTHTPQSTDAPSDPPPTAATAPPETLPRTTEPTTTAAPATTVFAPTPQDVLDRMAAAKKTAANDKKGGAIVARTYVKEGVTNQFGAVRVKNTNQTQISLKRILAQRADLRVDKDEPTVLIFHTHTTETYQLLDRKFYSKDFSARSNDSGRNMVRVGDAICEALEAAGYRVLHDTEIYDAHYNGAYERSRAAVRQYLEKYPSLQITLDIHRDAIQLADGTKIKPVAAVRGRTAAQIMIISGCQEAGNNVTDFPDWEKNLVFAAQLQQTLETDFPGLTRPLFFCPRRYNMHLTPCSLLIEVGTDANTLAEAVLTGTCVGTSLAHLMKMYETEAGA